MPPGTQMLCTWPSSILRYILWAAKRSANDWNAKARLIAFLRGADKGGWKRARPCPKCKRPGYHGLITHLGFFENHGKNHGFWPLYLLNIAPSWHEVPGSCGWQNLWETHQKPTIPGDGLTIPPNKNWWVVSALLNISQLGLLFPILWKNDETWNMFQITTFYTFLCAQRQLKRYPSWGLAARALRIEERRWTCYCSKSPTGKLVNMVMTWGSEPRSCCMESKLVLVMVHIERSSVASNLFLRDSPGGWIPSTGSCDPMGNQRTRRIFLGLWGIDRTWSK